MSRSVVYVGAILEGSVADAFGIQNYSLAGEHKKRSVIQAIQSTGDDVSVVAPVQVAGSDVTAHRGAEFVDDDLDVPVHVPPSLGVFGLEFVVLALTTLFVTGLVARRTDADVIVFYNFKIQTTVPALVGSWLASAALVVEYEDGMFVDPETASVVRTAAEWLRRTAGVAVDGGICASGPLATLLATDNVTVFRGFPSVGMPDELPEPDDVDGPPTVMFSGRFDDVRGIDTFLDVVPAVDGQVEDARFWVAGYGDEQTRTRVEAEAESLACDVTYFGTLPWDEYRERIVSADVLVNFQDPTLPISEYTFPSKLLDYMSAGATVVSTDVGDVGMALDDELYVAGYDQEALSTAVVTCLTDDRTACYGERARDWVRTECEPAVVGERIATVLESSTG